MANRQSIKHCLFVGEFYRRLSVNLNRCPHWSSVPFTSKQIEKLQQHRQHQQERQHSFLTSTFVGHSSRRDIVRLSACSGNVSSTVGIEQPLRLFTDDGTPPDGIPHRRYCSRQFSTSQDGHESGDHDHSETHW